MVVLVIPVAVQAVDVDPTDFEGLALSAAINTRLWEWAESSLTVCAKKGTVRTATVPFAFQNHPLPPVVQLIAGEGMARRWG